MDAKTNDAPPFAVPTNQRSGFPQIWHRVQHLAKEKSKATIITILDMNDTGAAGARKRAELVPTTVATMADSMLTHPEPEMTGYCRVRNCRNSH